MKCPRVKMRMECPECGYPYCEAMYALDPTVPHVGEEDKSEHPQVQARAG